MKKTKILPEKLIQICPDLCKDNLLANKFFTSLRERSDTNSDEDLFLELSKIQNLDTIDVFILNYLKTNYPSLSLRYLSKHPKYSQYDND